MAPRQRRARRADPGLASGLDAAFREGRRDLAGPLRRRTPGARASTPSCASADARPASARAPTARTATPASRCATRSPARRSRPSSRPCCARPASSDVVVCGLATDYCVKATALDAARLGFDTTVLDRCDRRGGPRAGDGERALDEMRGGRRARSLGRRDAMIGVASLTPRPRLGVVASWRRVARGPAWLAVPATRRRRRADPQRSSSIDAPIDTRLGGRRRHRAAARAGCAR